MTEWEPDEPPEPTTDADVTANSDSDGERAISDRCLGIAVLTIATERSLATDAAGEAIATALEAAGHELATREHIGSDHDRVQSIVSRLIDRDDVDLVVTAGATSVEPSDVTIEAVEPLLDKRLTAFDELFTRLAYDEVGTRVVAARTVAGVADGVPVFCLPGNEGATRLGFEDIVLPEAIHLVNLAREDRNGDRWAVDEDDAERKTESVYARWADVEPADDAASTDGGE